MVKRKITTTELITQDTSWDNMEITCLMVKVDDPCIKIYENNATLTITNSIIDGKSTSFHAILVEGTSVDDPSQLNPTTHPTVVLDSVKLQNFGNSSKILEWLDTVTFSSSFFNFKNLIIRNNVGTSMPVNFSASKGSVSGTTFEKNKGIYTGALSINFPPDGLVLRDVFFTSNGCSNDQCLIVDLFFIKGTTLTGCTAANNNMTDPAKFLKYNCRTGSGSEKYLNETAFATDQQLCQN